MSKRGRPMGPVLIAVLERIKNRHMTAREVAYELQLSMDEAKNACRRLHDAEMIVVQEKIKLDGVNKRVRVYAAESKPKPALAMMAANVFAKSKK